MKSSVEQITEQSDDLKFKTKPISLPAEGGREALSTLALHRAAMLRVSRSHHQVGLCCGL